MPVAEDEQGRFQQPNHPIFQKRGWKVCWVNPGEEFKDANGVPFRPPREWRSAVDGGRTPAEASEELAEDLGSFVYRHPTGNAFSFETSGVSPRRSDVEFFDGHGALQILKVDPLTCCQELRTTPDTWSLDDARRTFSELHDMLQGAFGMRTGIHVQRLPGLVPRNGRPFELNRAGRVRTD